MINQKLYPDIKLGNGSVTIATDGCYEMSLLRGLQLRGHNFGVRDFNQYLIDRGVFSKGSALLSAATIAARCPDIFLEGRNEAWSDAGAKKYTSDSSYILIGEVSGKGIGGSGQHFVLIDHFDFDSSGKVTMTWIDDPWDGLENQKVTTRYNKFGNILSFRVFKIKPQGGDMAANYYPSANSEWKIDLNNPAAVKAAVDGWVKVASGQMVDKSKYEQDLKAQKEQLTRDADNRVSLQEQGVRSRLAAILGVGPGEELGDLYDMVEALKNRPPQAAEIPAEVTLKDGSKWERNGLQLVVGSFTANYDKKSS